MFGKRIATGADFIKKYAFQSTIRILRANSIKAMRCVQSHDTQRFRVRFLDSQLKASFRSACESWLQTYPRLRGASKYVCYANEGYWQGFTPLGVVASQRLNNGICLWVQFPS